MQMKKLLLCALVAACHAISAPIRTFDSLERQRMPNSFVSLAPTFAISDWSTGIHGVGSGYVCGVEGPAL